MNDLIVDVKVWGERVGCVYWEKERNGGLLEYEGKLMGWGVEICGMMMGMRE